MASKKILIIDDELDMAQMLRVILETRGYLCSIATNGRDGLQSIQNEHPALVTLDYMMPGMTGAEMFRQLRTNETFTTVSDTPVIMLTAKSDNEEEQKELLSLGLAAYLIKPFSYTILLQKIDETLKNRK
ncbi:MAG: response regulator [Blastocatellia bacterium]|nr:response regulator [Blastocatellia bacterium]